MIYYPPVVDYSMPAFLATKKSINFYFTLPKLSIINSTIGIQYKVVYQENNLTALEDGELISSKRNYVYDSTLKKYYVVIDNANWVSGKVYKVQIRFYYRVGEMSEWSTVCYLKATSEPTLSILNQNDGNVQIVQSPLFYGSYNNVDSTEVEYKYRFKLMNNLQTETYQDSGEQIHLAGNSYDSWIFESLLNDFTSYSLVYSIITKNGYESSTSYQFVTSFAMLNDTVNFYVDGTNNYEKGSITLNITSDVGFTGNLILKRTSSKSNFLIWEDYKIFNILNETVNITYEDYLVESQVVYQYGIQRINTSGFRGKLTQSSKITASYEDIFLVGDDTELTIKFNSKIGNLKRNILETKQDTIGSKYPFILRNGDTNYFSFSLSGLISYYSNANGCFNAITPTEDNRTINLTDENAYSERIFREKVEEFLTNGNSKIFKSPTEGLKIISITGVSLTPQDKLGRMLYDFSSTAYEIADFSLTKSLDLGILNTGEVKRSEDMGTKTILGSWTGSNLAEGFDIYKAIGDSLVQVENGSKRNLVYLSSVILREIDIKDRQFVINDAIINVGAQRYYELKDLLKITSLKSRSIGTSLIIDYVAVVNYSEIDSEENPVQDMSNYKIVSGFGQITNTFSGSMGTQTLSVVEAVKSAYGLDKFFSLSYLRINTTRDAVMTINGNKIIITANTGYELRDVPVTSCDFAEATWAQVDFIYNGYKIK